jgi:hypothetical protein
MRRGKAKISPQRGARPKRGQVVVLAAIAMVALVGLAALTTDIGCLYSLDPTGSSAFSLTGSGSITSGCGMMVGSSSSSALTLTGSGSITASSVGVVGNYSLGGSGSITPTPVTGIAPVGDPLSNLAAPAVGSGTYTGEKISGSSSITLSPGVYCNGISVKGSSTVTFNSGTYVLLGGGLSAKGSGSLSGTGVTFYNTYNSTCPYAGIDMSGSGSMNFSAPTSGSLAGYWSFRTVRFQPARPPASSTGVAPPPSPAQSICRRQR